MSQPTYKLDAEYQEAAAPFMAIPHAVAYTLPELLKLTHDSIYLTMLVFPCPEAQHVVETTYDYTSKDGTLLTLHRFTPNTIPSASSSSRRPSNAAGANGGGGAANGGPLRPAVLYLHGGGFICGSVQVFRKDIARYALATGTTFFAPSYRLAPENPYPKPLEDVTAALEYLHAHAPQLGIDRARLGVMGVSAGGALAAAAALVARDQGLQPPIKKLMLLCPMLDDRTTMRMDPPLERLLTWTGKKNELAWGAYLTVLRMTAAEVPAYAAPARAEDLAGLPKTYIDVGELDLFLNEATDFSERLQQAGVEVDSYSYPGVPHAWEWIAPSAAVSRKALENRLRALGDL
jgi:acetyl esterase/lipase